MRFRLAGGLDLATGALVLGGALLVAAAIVAAIVTLSPPPASPTSQPEQAPTTQTRPSDALSPDRVAAVISLDPTAAAGGAARPGDHVDLLGYFPKQASSQESVTRVLVEEVPVLSVDRDGASVALTVALRQESALLVHEAQALGAKPFVALRPLDAPAGSIAPAIFSDSDLARRLAGAP
jgi:Flp pilus assembly protein CpaB